MLKRRELRAAMEMTRTIERRVLVPDGDPMRLLSTPIMARGEPLAVVVGATLDARDDALEELVAELLLGGPAVLLLATLTAYGVARAALRPVESMRAQAAAISGAEPGRRLALPRTRDELWRLGETLNAMLARLEHALARERSFVSDASHELRTPLATLKMELALAVRHGGSRDELEGAVRSAAEEADRLVRIAEDLLVIARSEQRRLPVHREDCDIGAVFATMLERFAGRAERLGRSLEATAPPGTRVSADRLRLEQAVGNLLDNALRYGGGRVRLQAEVGDAGVVLHVLDEGPGFPPEFLERAFERFSRADEARGRGGSGLGLAVVEGIALAHGGEVSAVNRESGGADVSLSLPRVEVARGREAALTRSP